MKNIYKIYSCIKTKILKSLFKPKVLFLYVLRYCWYSFNDKLSTISPYTKQLNKYLSINEKGQVGMRMSPQVRKFKANEKIKNQCILYKGLIEGLALIPNKVDKSFFKKNDDGIVSFVTHEIIYKRFEGINEICSNLCSVEVIKNEDQSEKETYIFEELFMYSFIDLIKKNTDDLEELLSKSKKATVKIKIDNIEKTAYALKNVRKLKNNEFEKI